MKIGYCDIINIAGIDFYKDVGKDLYFYKDAMLMENTGVKRLPTESELELLSESPYVIKDGYCYFANSLLDLNDENILRIIEFITPSVNPVGVLGNSKIVVELLKFSPKG